MKFTLFHRQTVSRWNGQSLSSGQLAKIYGFTDLDGSRIRHDVAYSDRDFTPEGLTEVLTPPAASGP